MAYPKIIWAGTTLTFTYPPVMKPYSDNRTATRSKSITYSGRVQLWLSRIDVFRTLQIDFIPQEDLPDWEDFIDYALEGFQFDYYPDSADVGFDTFILEDDSWNPAQSLKVMAKVKLKLRRVTPESTGS